MTQAPETARPAGRPDPAALAQEYLRGHVTGLEGREAEVGRAVLALADGETGLEGREERLGSAVLTAMRSLKHTHPYEHEINDALVKSWLVGIKFAKQRGLLAEYVQNDVDTLKPITRRMGELARATGEPELALEAICGWSTCHYQLVITPTIKTPGARTFLSPFKTALDAGRRIGQFDFDERFVHENWFTPRAHGLAADLGFPVEVSPWDEETRLVTVSLA